MERRREALRQAHASNRIEGLYRNPKGDAAYEAFIRGEIELNEIMPRIKALNLLS
jgi:Antitoxin VbhA